MSRKAAVRCWFAAGAIGASWFIAWGFGVRINTTDSVPMGLWLEHPAPAAVARGQYVAICPLNTSVFQIARSRQYIDDGWCPDHYEVLFKPVAAVAGDQVTVTAAGIAVNGSLIRNSASLAQDSDHRALQRFALGTYTVARGTVWLVSDYNPRSFDSRYFGPMPVTEIRGVVTPLLVRAQHD